MTVYNTIKQMLSLGENIKDTKTLYAQFEEITRIIFCHESSQKSILKLI